jgi:hypothetical protein
VLVDEVPDAQGQVLAALAQRRHRDREEAPVGVVGFEPSRSRSISASAWRRFSSARHNMIPSGFMRTVIRFGRIGAEAASLAARILKGEKADAM